MDSRRKFQGTGCSLKFVLCSLKFTWKRTVVKNIARLFASPPGAWRARNWYTKFKLKQRVGLPPLMFPRWGTSHRFLSHRIHGGGGLCLLCFPLRFCWHIKQSMHNPDSWERERERERQRQRDSTRIPGISVQIYTRAPSSSYQTHSHTRTTQNENVCVCVCVCMRG